MVLREGVRHELFAIFQLIISQSPLAGDKRDDTATAAAAEMEYSGVNLNILDEVCVVVLQVVCIVDRHSVE